MMSQYMHSLHHFMVAFWSFNVSAASDLHRCTTSQLHGRRDPTGNRVDDAKAQHPVVHGDQSTCRLLQYQQLLSIPLRCSSTRQELLHLQGWLAAAATLQGACQKWKRCKKAHCRRHVTQEPEADFRRGMHAKAMNVVSASGSGSSKKIKPLPNENEVVLAKVYRVEQDLAMAYIIEPDCGASGKIHKSEIHTGFVDNIANYMWENLEFHAIVIPNHGTGTGRRPDLWLSAKRLEMKAPHIDFPVKLPRR
eukprot:3211275-Amphidinium_carterae.1